MNVLNESRRRPGHELELLQVSSLGLDADAILADFTHYFTRMLGRRTLNTDDAVPLSGPGATPSATA